MDHYEGFQASGNINVINPLGNGQNVYIHMYNCFSGETRNRDRNNRRHMKCGKMRLKYVAQLIIRTLLARSTHSLVLGALILG